MSAHNATAWQALAAVPRQSGTHTDTMAFAIARALRLEAQEYRPIYIWHTKH